MKLTSKSVSEDLQNPGKIVPEGGFGAGLMYFYGYGAAIERTAQIRVCMEIF